MRPGRVEQKAFAATQGLYNRYTALWNNSPSVDEYPEYLFDWRYPQFFANKKGHEERLARHALAHP